MVLSTEWAQVEVVELGNDGNGLGFHLVGGRSTGVVVKSVVPGGAADRDGRLQPGDHLLQVGAVNVRGLTSEQVAGVVRAAGAGARLVVARPAPPTPAPAGAALLPTRLLHDPDCLHQHLLAAAAQFYLEPDCQEPEITVTAPPPEPPQIPELPEVEIVNVTLCKNVYGLGITVAGYVCEKEELSGIFVKSIIDGSSAEQSGKIRINDRIVEVDGISLLDKSNPQAVEILKKTSISVNLVLERYLRGPKFEHLQLAIFSNEDRPASPSPSGTTTLSWFPVPSQLDNTTIDIEPEQESNTTIDSNILEIANNDIESIVEPTREELDIKLDKILTEDREEIKKKWEDQIGLEKDIIVAEVTKLSGLGISLEGTVEVEGGQEVRPRHYIRSVLPDGPVGLDGSLAAGDELLQINDKPLVSLTHSEVVNILKQLPNRVRLVCARNSIDAGPRPVVNLAPDREGFEARKIISGSFNNLTLVKALSETSLHTSSTATLTNHSGNSKKSHSLECVTGLAMWQDKEVFVELVKADQGLGFSILDYQDPVDPHGTVIVVRSLVPGGVAEKNGEIAPGDRVLSVNGVSIRNSTLDQAVQALKGAARGVVKVGIARPLPSHDASKSTTNLNPKTS